MTEGDRPWDTLRVSTIAQLDVESVSVEAGGRVTLPLSVRNTGDVVEDYEIEILGIPAAWTTVDPPTFTLYPGTAQEATVDVHPPRTSAVPAGEMRLGVHVVPTEHPDQGVVPEAVIDVLPYLETTAELVPRTSHGRFGAKHHVAIDNRGNVPVTVLLIPVAGSDALTVTAEPESLTVNPGQAAFGDIHARPAGRLWRGVPLMLPFSLTVAPQGSPEVQLEAGHVQDPILPKWLPKALLALLALLLLLLAFWYLLMRPAVVAAAEEAVAEPVQSAQADAAAAKQASDQAAAAKTGSDKAAAAAKTEAGKSATSADAAAKSAGVSKSKSKFVTLPFSERLSVEAPAGQRRRGPLRAEVERDPGSHGPGAREHPG